MCLFCVHNCVHSRLTEKYSENLKWTNTEPLRAQICTLPSFRLLQFSYTFGWMAQTNLRSLLGLSSLILAYLIFGVSIKTVLQPFIQTKFSNSYFNDQSIRDHKQCTFSTDFANTRNDKMSYLISNVSNTTLTNHTLKHDTTLSSFI